MRLYLIKGCDSVKFKKYDVVKLITVISKAYLVEKIGTDEREWIMIYDLYPLTNHNISGFHEYDNKYQKQIPDKYYLNKMTNEIEILNEPIENEKYIKINTL